MDALTLTELADMCHGTLHAGNPSQTVRRISKDTRTLVPGDLYLALRGEKHDGNIYAKEAVAKGAAGAILDAVPDGLPADFPIIVVDDTLVALHRLAAAWRDRLALRSRLYHRKQRKTSTQGVHRGGPLCPLPRCQNRGELEQPHRPASLDFVGFHFR